ncbi:hypothetical protein C2845_PM13G08020 [Panicum miliaceum]|uniref:Uncharacterized protein n=1 Tax=Panicum miliaceum TaxID=4540 RepID=A0A3L6RJS4_PANMI|nr:hypothetical protein C2845_PM13G08020 [Panicum miliaceum]
MPRAGLRSKPVEKSAEAPTHDSTAIVQAEASGQDSSCGTQGDPSTGGQSTTQDQGNLLQTDLKSNEECMHKEEFTSRNGKEDVEKDDETNVKKLIENLKMGSEEDKKTAALLEERHRQRVGGAKMHLGGAANMPARRKHLATPAFANTPAANMSAFLPPNKKKQAKTARVTANGSTGGTSSTAGTGIGNKAQKKATASSSSSHASSSK